MRNRKAKLLSRRETLSSLGEMVGEIVRMQNDLKGPNKILTDLQKKGSKLYAKYHRRFPFSNEDLLQMKEEVQAFNNAWQETKRKLNLGHHIRKEMYIQRAGVPERVEKKVQFNPVVASKTFSLSQESPPKKGLLSTQRVQAYREAFDTALILLRHVVNQTFYWNEHSSFLRKMPKGIGDIKKLLDTAKGYEISTHLWSKLQEKLTSRSIEGNLPGRLQADVYRAINQDDPIAASAQLLVILKKIMPVAEFEKAWAKIPSEHRTAIHKKQLPSEQKKISRPR